MTAPAGSLYATSDAMLAAKGRSFHWARRLLGTAHASRATRLYGFCRRIDDIADEEISGDEARTALAAVAQALTRGSSSDPWVTDGIALFAECQIRPAIPLALIDGVLSDLSPVRIADEAELLRYCYRVAGTVGLMMSSALDVTSKAALPHAIDLGIAMQLTNICRDVSEDAGIGRRYVPATLIGTVDPSQLIVPPTRLQPTLKHAVRSLLSLADQYYRSGEAGLSYLPGGARTGIRVAGRVYRGIGQHLRRRDYDCWSARAFVPMSGKALITAQALAMSAQALVSPVQRQPHNQELHKALAGLPDVNWPSIQSGAV